MPSTDVILRDGSFALASFGRIRKDHERAFAVAIGRRSFVLKAIVETALGTADFPGKSTFADLIDVLVAMVFTPINRLGV
jgi:hypothetical protein